MMWAAWSGRWVVVRGALFIGFASLVRGKVDSENEDSIEVGAVVRQSRHRDKFQVCTSRRFEQKQMAPKVLLVLFV